MERSETYIYDDLTGQRLIESTRVEMVLYIGAEKEQLVLDLEPKTLSALLTAVRDHEWAPLRRIFTGEPESKAKAERPEKEKAVGDKRLFEVNRGRVFVRLPDVIVSV